MRLEASIRRRDELGRAEITAMFELYDRYYGRARASDFRTDLSQKSHLIELREGATLRGFSTLALQRYELAEETGLAIFSGDTIIEHEYWGEQVLARAFCRFAGGVHAEHPVEPLYWFLISKGYRTYRYLQAFARRYYPHPHEPTPERMKLRMDALAVSRFGTCYLPEQGVVRFEPARGYLRAPWNHVRAGLRTRAEVRYFLERNPGYVNGDELVCIAELSTDNLRSVAAREFGQAYRDAAFAVSS